MFIKKIIKKNKNSGKEYIYYRLTHSYKIGDKIRHQNILNLGKLEGLDKIKFKALADRIEELVTGNSSTLFPDYQKNKKTEDLAQQYANKIITEKLFIPSNFSKKTISKATVGNYQEIDLDTVEQIESKEIGGEWLIKQTMDRLGFENILSETGMNIEEIEIAQNLLTSKAIYPSSELGTERWLNNNSAIQDLYNINSNITRYKLYKAASKMYNNKELIDKQLYKNVESLFKSRSKIIIYDLTNMYFEGQMLGSEKAEFGRSKQKQSGSKLIGLAISIDSMGFVKHNKFYKGNVSEPGTFKNMLSDVSSSLDTGKEKPVVVMDAGISSEENLQLIRETFNYDYVCVSRTVPKEYIKLTQNAKSITDNRDNEIQLTKVTVEGKDDNFLHVKSSQKEKKEISIDNKLSKRLEAQLQDIKEKLPKARTLKKAEKVHEKVGKIKAQLSKVGWLYDITYVEDKEKGIVTDINWKRKKEKEKPKGQYFLRYTKTTVSENDIWNVYNMTRDVEAVFRCLKMDLNIRPIYHQIDKFIEPHIWLGILAYQLVNYIRITLKDRDINYSWASIVEKMKMMQSSIISANNTKNEKLYIKLCTRPSTEQKNIFDALDYKHRPFTRKTKVVPQM